MRKITLILALGLIGCTKEWKCTSTVTTTLYGTEYTTTTQTTFYGTKAEMKAFEEQNTTAYATTNCK